MFVVRNPEYQKLWVSLSIYPLRGEMVVLIHTGACVFHAYVEECPGAISALISIASKSEEGLGFSGLCVSELCFSPVLCFSELCVSPVRVPDLFLGEVHVEVRDSLLRNYPKSWYPPAWWVPMKVQPCHSEMWNNNKNCCCCVVTIFTVAHGALFSCKLLHAWAPVIFFSTTQYETITRTAAAAAVWLIICCCALIELLARHMPKATRGTSVLARTARA